MINVRLEPETERRLCELAERTGRTKSYYARALIEGNIDDLEDRFLAEERLARVRPPLGGKAVRSRAAQAICRQAHAV